MSFTLVLVFALSAHAGDANDGGLVAFEQAGKWGFRNAAGKVVVEPKYDEVREFVEGMAAVNVGAREAERSMRPLKEGGKWGYIDARGNIVVPIALDYVCDFSDGLAQVRDDRGVRYLDARGAVAIDLGKQDSIVSAGDFREGLAPVCKDRSLQGKDWLTGFIDKKGRTVFSVDGYAQEFHEGLAVLQVQKAPGHAADALEPHRCGYIGRDGKIVIPPRFAEAREFSAGLAAVRTKKTTIWGKGDTWGYIQRTGDYVIEPQFNEAHSFRGNVARVHVGGTLRVVLDAPCYWEGGEWLLIDKAGKVLKRSAQRLPYPEADGR